MIVIEIIMIVIIIAMVITMIMIRFVVSSVRRELDTELNANCLLARRSQTMPRYHSYIDDDDLYDKIKPGHTFANAAAPGGWWRPLAQVVHYDQNLMR